MFKSAARSHIGHLRACNEDSFIENIELGLWLVADGVGGNVHGDFASQVVSQTIERKIGLETTLTQAIKGAHSTVIKLGRDKPDIAGMASTVVAAHLKGTHYEICWVGDSRAYVINSQTGISQLTVDHNQAQYLVDIGEISPEEARLHPTQRILMHAIGINDDDWTVGHVEGDLSPDDIILLCSDGLSDEMDDVEILSAFQQGYSLDAITDVLLEKALNKGGSDNITLILVALDKQGKNVSEPDASLELEQTGTQQKAYKYADKRPLTFTVAGFITVLVIIAVAASGF
ncbi:PP2C family protein-serine/threonine phosphatase [Alkalimarinus alittae]|uniref:Protein phosphatase 2C domain-containing protein n=1 Tax=Alkalimarinus alittae TaxID=2961619 RepID=A0ABY6N6B0_9ALTE|nr:protein phosphatase 2C domain-containing protein [Alkalimarinus alittae]UZE97663.1 protein phosphatase 2C domain-containing protein [Alkalimarinus alittae]